MKIAIQGHLFKGHKVIRILESLGGINPYNHLGNNPCCYYEIHGNTIVCACTKSNNYKYYTLEEFEKEFPFKVGDLCIYFSGILNKEIIIKILGIAIKDDCIMYEIGHKDITKAHSGIYRKRYTLKPIEMKEERNITLTLDKAKEWYKKGGELKEIALQAYSEEELTKVDLPKTWEEFCNNYPVCIGESWLGTRDTINTCYVGPSPRSYKNWIPSKESAGAHLAMIQLEQLRDCWRQGWKPNYNNLRQPKYCVNCYKGGLEISVSYETSRFLSFPTKKMAEEFLECFRDLIEKAGDLI